MGKFKNTVDTGALRVGNTIATPVRRGGEIANALWNVSRQGLSSVKNIKEVQIQALNAVADNFLNFSKVEGKGKFFKRAINLVSAVTRRPFMLAGAEGLSTLNQGLRQPFKKLLYTPGKMLKGMRNATRIFSKKKGFDFVQYDTHETKGDTWINKIREKGIGFFGKSKSGEKVPEAKKPEEAKKGETLKVEEIKKPEEVKKVENPHIESDVFQKKIQEKDDAFLDKELADRGFGPGGKLSKETKSESKLGNPAPKEEKPTKPATPEKKPSSIQDVKEEDKKKSEKADKAEKEKDFPEWKTLPDKFKKEYKKEYDKTLKNNPTPQGIIARGKESKMGDKPEEIIKNFKEKDPTFAGYMEEIFNKAA
ncbi:MAG: hypothetical protein NT085_04770 [candidate division SR1 bacterium]|nr:hypothetical protein [candidate division SR1 bacterium]